MPWTPDQVEAFDATYWPYVEPWLLLQQPVLGPLRPAERRKQELATAPSRVMFYLEYHAPFSDPTGADLSRVIERLGTKPDLIQDMTVQQYAEMLRNGAQFGRYRYLGLTQILPGWSRLLSYSDNQPTAVEAYYRMCELMGCEPGPIYPPAF